MTQEKSIHDNPGWVPCLLHAARLSIGMNKALIRQIKLGRSQQRAWVERRDNRHPLQLGVTRQRQASCPGHLNRMEPNSDFAVRVAFSKTLHAVPQARLAQHSVDLLLQCLVVGGRNQDTSGTAKLVDLSLDFVGHEVSRGRDRAHLRGADTDEKAIPRNETQEVQCPHLMNKGDQCSRGASDGQGIHQGGREDRTAANLTQNSIEGDGIWKVLNHQGPENVVLAGLWDKSQTPLKERIVANVLEEAVVSLPVMHGGHLFLLGIKDARLANDPSQPLWVGIRN